MFLHTHSCVPVAHAGAFEHASRTEPVRRTKTAPYRQPAHDGPGSRSPAVIPVLPFGVPPSTRGAPPYQPTAFRGCPLAFIIGDNRCYVAFELGAALHRLCGYRTGVRAHKAVLRTRARTPLFFERAVYRRHVFRAFKVPANCVAKPTTGQLFVRPVIVAATQLVASRKEHQQRVEPAEHFLVVP